MHDVRYAMCESAIYIYSTHTQTDTLTLIRSHSHIQSLSYTPTRKKLVSVQVAPHSACIVRVSHTIYDKCTSIDYIDHQLIDLHTLTDKEIILIDRYVYRY